MYDLTIKTIKRMDLTGWCLRAVNILQSMYQLGHPVFVFIYYCQKIRMKVSKSIRFHFETLYSASMWGKSQQHSCLHNAQWLFPNNNYP